MSRHRKNPPSKAAKDYFSELQRARGTRPLKQRHLIVCEDDASAPAYFKALKRHFKLHAASVEIVGSKGRTSPSQVVDRAIQRKALAESADSGSEPFDKVWCVIDGDYGDKIPSARKTAKTEGVEILVSTPCFEHWILLHFEDSAKASLQCKNTIRLIEKHVREYKKGSFPFDSIVDRATTAAGRAAKRRDSSTKAENQNPCSEIYRLIREIQPDSE